MSKEIKIVVVTLEAGEAEFNDCVSAANKQKYVEIEHVVVSGLNERAAHSKLVSIWYTRKEEFDFLAKVDADTILNSDTALASMSELMEMEKASGLQVRLWDYFSQDLIPGLNMFSREIHFKTKIPRLKPDQIDLEHTKVLKGSSVAHLEPIGWHGRNPSPKQSFYFGYHRWLKGQAPVLKSCFELWQIHDDDARKWALVGALTAHQKKFGKFLFSSNKAMNSFTRVEIRPPSNSQIHNFVNEEILSHD